MPRYLVERTFPETLAIPVNETGAQVCRTVVTNNTEELVTWVHSYVSQDKTKTFCIYDAPSPEKQPAGRSDYRSVGPGPLFLPLATLRSSPSQFGLSAGPRELALRSDPFTKAFGSDAKPERTLSHISARSTSARVDKRGRTPCSWVGAPEHVERLRGKVSGLTG
jgi:hypothetical protein